MKKKTDIEMERRDYLLHSVDRVPSQHYPFRDSFHNTAFLNRNGQNAAKMPYQRIPNNHYYNKQLGVNEFCKRTKRDFFVKSKHSERNITHVTGVSFGVHVRKEDQNQKYKCKDCEAAFPSGYILQQHQLAYHSNHQKLIPGRSRLDVFNNCVFSEDFLHNNDNTRKNAQEDKRWQESGGVPEDQVTKSVKLSSYPSNPTYRKEVTSNQKRDHGDQNEKTAQCEICGQRFQGEYAMELVNRHKRKHHSGRNASKYRFSCDFCTLKFLNQPSLKCHIYCQHKNARFMFNCEKCKMTLSTAKLLEIHLQTHLKTVEKPKTVGNCRKETVSETPIVKKLSQFQCIQCQQSFLTQDGLQHHELRTHVAGGDKPYPCKKCTKGFLCPKKLQEHDFHYHGIALPCKTEIKEEYPSSEEE